MQLILASSSPYRKSMLERLGIPFTTQSPDIDETPLESEAPTDLALRLSKNKAYAIAQAHAGALVIGSDQVATINGTPIGKPGSYERAQQQLQELSGKTVEFHSALCVTNGKQDMLADVITQCRFRTLTNDEISNYLKRDTPYDTAGSAKAESLGIALMESIRSDDPTAIVGLPLIELCRMLRAFGMNPLTHELI